MNLNNVNLKFIIFILIIGILAFVLPGCSNTNDQHAASQAAAQSSQNDAPFAAQPDSGRNETTISVEVESVSRDTLTTFVQVVGEARPYRDVDLIPELQERVEKVNVEIGDHVDKGDILLELNHDDKEIAVKQAEASLAVAEANLEEALNGTREEEIIQLKADLSAAKSNLKIAQSNYGRYNELYEQGFISKKSFEDYENQLISAKSTYESVQQSLVIAEAGSTAQEIKSLNAQVIQAETSLVSAKLDLGKTVVKAPISGFISDLNIELGEQIANTSVMTISQLNPIRIKSYVSQRDVNKLNVGDQVKIYFSAIDTGFEGKIRNISPVADQSKKSFQVDIIVDNSEYIIKAGMYADVRLSTSQVTDQIVISQSAIMEEDEEEYVYIVSDSRAKRISVETGISSEDQIVILSGLSEGEQVVVTGVEYLKDGINVNIVDQGDK